MAEQSGFKRNVGLFMAVMIGIGAIMGPGVFVLPSVVQVCWFYPGLLQAKRLRH